MPTIDPVEVIVLLASLSLLIRTIEYQRRKQAQEHEQNQALFKEHLRQHRQSGPPEISLLQLTQRQLAVWESRLAEMERSPASAKQLRHCRQQVERLRKEVAWLKEQH